MTDHETLAGATVDDRRIIAGLRAGDEATFVELVDKYQGSLVRVAMRYVPGRAVAEEVVQDTRIAVIEGVDRFEGRSTLKTWLYRILIYQSRARGERERRTTPMSSLVALPEPTRAELELHVATCAGCIAYIEQMRATQAALERLESIDTSAEPPDDRTRSDLVAIFRARRV